MDRVSKHADRMSAQPVRVGTAGWSLPRAAAEQFPAEGSHLARYAARLGCVEINSSFYRPHRRSTYARWGLSVPGGFRFAVKAPKAITHERRLIDCNDLLDRFLDEIAGLGDRLGPVLVQLPPSFAFESARVGGFFEDLRRRFDGLIACEPRHASWFTDDAEALLDQARVARVAADPAPHPRAAQPGGWTGLVYRRRHGAPRIYYSDYEPARLDEIAEALRTVAVESWCIFDNTALGCAILNALAVQARLA